MMTSYSITRASVEDVASIRALLIETWASTYGSILSETTLQLAADSWHSEDVLSQQITDPDIYFSVTRHRQESIIGLVTAHQRAPDSILVSRLYVLPAFQRMGIGNKLMAAVAAAFPHAQLIQLNVESQNTKGRAFYLKAGFMETGAHCQQVGDDTLNVIEMSYELNS